MMNWRKNGARLPFPCNVCAKVPLISSRLIMKIRLPQGTNLSNFEVRGHEITSCEVRIPRAKRRQILLNIKMKERQRGRERFDR